MGRVKSKKKMAAGISGKVEARIVALCLQNPDFGARRLLPLLQKRKIRVTSSQIYTILKRHGLQTRTKRLARLKEKPAKKTSAAKKKPVRILPEVEKQIVKISLRNPEFGAQRLVPLLAAEGIKVSASGINAVLRRNGLGSRDKRLAKLAEPSRKKRSSTARKKPAKITDKVGERIVQISLQNPDFGARRLLPVLERDGIILKASAVYRVLKRKGLENREKRLARSQGQLIAEAMPEETVESPPLGPLEISPQPEEPEWEPEAIDPIMLEAAEEPEWGPEVIEPIIPEPAVKPQDIPEIIEQKTAPPAAEPQPVPEIIEEEVKPPRAEPQRFAPEIIGKIPPSPVPVDVTALKKSKIRGPWFLTLGNLLLLLLLGFLSFYAWQNVFRSNLEPEPIAAIPPAPAIAPAKPETAAPPLSSYRIISERDLFNVSKAETPAPKKEVDLEKIDPAQKNLGLTLVGTVVGDNPNRSIAIIDNQQIRRQEAYREGDQANEVRIKKIMRNKVIIVTEEGDRLLTVEIKKAATRSKTPSYARNIPGYSGTPAQATAARSSSINLDMQEVSSAFEDTEKLLQEVNVAPYMQGDQPAGFRLNRIPARNILRKMGLRSRDIIVGVNGETISGPEQAEQFIRTLAQGGEVTIKLKRRRRTREIKLNIQ